MVLATTLLGRARLCSRCLPAPSKRFASSSPRPASIPHPVVDLSAVLESPEAVKSNLRQRKYPLEPAQVDALRDMELEAAQLRKDLQAARERRNVASSALKEDMEARRAASEVKKLIKQIEPRLAALTKDIQAIALQLPNMSHPDVPIGDETQARLVRRIGDMKTEDSPTAEPERDHLALSSPSNLAWTDFPSSSITTGSSWPLLLNEGALLEMALTNYAMSVALSYGFTPALTPDVVRSDVSERCGFRPRDGEAQQTYFLSDGESVSSLCLAGTAEIPLVAMSAGQTFRADQLPVKHVALGRAFRAEAGARGADSRGLYRVHQFSKVEMVILCAEEQSNSILEELRAIQEEILGNLGLSLRVLDMPTEELGASAHRKYDIEAWMPGRGKWGELSSASNCTDYQSRRLGIRYRPSHASTNDASEAPSSAGTRSSGPKLAFVHTLNGTAAAIPRLIVALLENGAVLDAETGRVSRVRLPECLKPFWLGRGTDTRIEWAPAGESLRLP
ncbi:hypothetical protein JCM10908_000996 [Rhodotorula pacifica]|uniref:putative serine--tRNA ligase DIA4 n=1 Tax=Rhodotorula pacifica TaxID=1495444 RepID=UPI00317741D3